MSEIRVRQNGPNVLVALNNRVIAEIPAHVALELSRALLSVGRKAEEREQIERIITDHAILARAGATIGLTSDPRALEEVKKEAAWNRDLRRYMPSVKSGLIFGAPTILNRPKNKGGDV